MKTLFLKSFYRDLEKIKNPKTAGRILKEIEKIEATDSISGVSGVKKMKGATNAFRIRICDYRLGFYILENNTVQVARILNRKDIYKVFP